MLHVTFNYYENWFWRKKIDTFSTILQKNRLQVLKRNKPKEVNVVDDITKDMSDIDLTTIIYEMNLVGSNPKEWWTNNGANHHVCYDKKMFSTFEPIENGKSYS